MQVKIIKMYDDVKTPVYATEGSACFDIYSRSVASDGQYSKTEVHGTGLKFEIPKGKALMIYSRSGHGFKGDIRLANCVGVIDSDYRGELMVKLTCDARDAHFVNARVGERVAQGMLVDAQQVGFDVVTELSETQRGEGGFGSTNGSVL